MIEQLTKDNFKHATSWWQERWGHTHPIEMLPDTCYYSVLDNQYVAFLALYLPKKDRGGTTAWTELCIANPESSYDFRTIAIHELLDHTEKVAKEYGIIAMMTVTDNENYMKRLERQGYNITDRGGTTLIKSLYK